MRAAVRTRWGKPEEVIRLADVPTPQLADDGVLVRIRAASVNRADYYAVASPALLLRPMLGGLLRPKTEAIGGDFAGVVEAVGSDVAGFEPGDEVFGARTGAFAEYVCARMVARKPANVSFEEAAAVPTGGLTALQAIRDHGRLEPGQRVLVNGASGAVGTFAVQIAKALGAGHVAAVCSTRNVEQTRALGADRVIDYTADDFTRAGERYDLIVDVAGNRSWPELQRVLEPDATVVLVGVPLSRNRVLGPLGAIAGRWVTSRRGSPRNIFFVAKFNRPDLDTLGELLASGQIHAVIERAYPLAEVADALRVMGEGHARAKLVVTV